MMSPPKQPQRLSSGSWPVLRGWITWTDPAVGGSHQLPANSAPAAGRCCTGSAVSSNWCGSNGSCTTWCTWRWRGSTATCWTTSRKSTWKHWPFTCPNMVSASPWSCSWAFSTQQPSNDGSRWCRAFQGPVASSPGSSCRSKTTWSTVKASSMNSRGTSCSTGCWCCASFADLCVDAIRPWCRSKTADCSAAARGSTWSAWSSAVSGRSCRWPSPIGCWCSSKTWSGAGASSGPPTASGTSTLS